MATDLQPHPTPTAATLRRLILRIGRQTLAFSTVGNDGKVRYEQHPVKSGISMAANLREALNSAPMLGDSYNRVTVMADTPVLMVPTDLFRDGEQDELYHHAYTHLEQQAVMHFVLADMNAVAVFGIHKDLRTVLVDRYGDVRFMPVAAPVWRHLHQRSFTGTRQKLYAYFHDQHMEVFSFIQNRFRFCNTFEAQNADDALYYLLAAWKQTGLAADQDELHLAGQMPDDGELTEKARQFIKRVYNILPSGEFNRAQVTQIEGMPYDLITYYMKGR